MAKFPLTLPVPLSKPLPMSTAHLTIDLDAIAANWRALDRASASGVQTAAVVKADVVTPLDPHLRELPGAPLDLITKPGVAVLPEDEGMVGLLLGPVKEAFGQVQRHGDPARIFLATASPMAQQVPATRAEACARGSADRHLPAAQRLVKPMTFRLRSGIS